MSTTSPKQQAFAQLARIGNSLSSEVRLELLELIAQGERSVDQLSKLARISVANTSQHLQKLKQAGLITARKQGLHVFYRLTGDEVVGLLSALSRTGNAYLAEVDRILRTYYFSRDDFEPIGATELLDRATKGLVTVLDVRPPEEFAQGHVPGALNIPVEELSGKLRNLPKGVEVVAYCRGPYCLMSFEAVRLLRKKGLKARRLADGLPEWRAAGLPVER